MITVIIVTSIFANKIKNTVMLLQFVDAFTFVIVLVNSVL